MQKSSDTNLWYGKNEMYDGQWEAKLTLLDILKLTRHYIKIVVIVVVISTMVGMGLGIAKGGFNNTEYTAESVLTVSDPTATVAAGELMPLTRAVADNVVAERSAEDVVISQKYDLASRTISFTAVSGDEAESIAAANSVAVQTAEQTATLLREMADRYRSEITAEESVESGEFDGTVTFGLSERNRAAALEMVSFTVNDALQAASSSDNSTAVKYGLVGFLGGLFLAICIMVIIDLAKAPLKGHEDVERCFDVPVLAEGNARSLGDRLWANTQFAIGEIPHSVCLVPAAETVPQGIEESLSSAIAANGARDVLVVACLPLGKSMDAAYVARDTDATVVCAVPWRDSLRQVADTLRELELAQAKVAGIVLINLGR